jgi:4-diphosphocytidyl-2-C-methyl-D-erythritol kinase
VSTTVELAAHAKVNLLLRVLAREADGYHNLETLFCRISLADTLRAERVEGGAVALEVTGADTGPAEQNLAVRAAEMVLEATGRKFGVRLTLTKRIPVKAGLGGGSSDGASALIAVNQLAKDAVPRHELLQFAAKLGSDVPFFISGGGLALAWGRGERMLRLSPLPPAPGLLLIPKIGVSTAEAYHWVDVAHRDTGRRGAIALDQDSLSSWGSIGRLAGNDFESAVFGHHPEIRQAFEALAKTHPLVCRMSGSGSALFAVYKNDGMRDDAVMMLGRKFGEVEAVVVGG